MCLSVKIERPNDVLAEGSHLGFEWAVVHNGMGYRCGYVKVTPSHPWFGTEPDVNVHGGITFARSDIPCGKDGPDDGWWLGFDCAHCDDAPDPELPKEGKNFSDIFKHHGVVRTQEYVESECRSLCEQAANAIQEK